MKILIVETDETVIGLLKGVILKAKPGTIITNCCSSIKATVKWLSKNPLPDLVFMKVQLPDGLAFEVFRFVEISCPVIFITADNRHLSDMLHYNAIAYLSIPLNPLQIRMALDKYENLGIHFLNGPKKFPGSLPGPAKHSRVVIKSTKEYHSIRTSDIIFVKTDTRTLCFCDINEKLNTVDYHNPDQIELLDASIFFRASRQYIININHIKSFRFLNRRRIHVDLACCADQQIIISEEKSAIFRKWLCRN